MSEIKDRQDAASDIDPIVAALADDMANDMVDDTWAAAAVEGSDGAAEPVDAEAEPVAGMNALIAPDAEAAELSDTGDEAIELLVAGSDAAADLAWDADADFGDETPAEAIAADDLAATEAVPIDDAPEQLAANAFEHMPAAYADTIVELDAEADHDEAPLLDVDIEDGIASVFAALHAAREDSAPVEPSGDLDAADGVTFRLLGELDRLWHRAA